MPSLQLYNKLLELPLFLGMSKSDLDEVVERTKFDFLKMESGQVVVKEGQLCDRLFLLTNGRINVTTVSDDHSYTFIEEIHAPTVFQIERTFGLSQRFASTYETVDTCNFIIIHKDEIMRLTDTYLVFRINFYNLLSATAQKAGHLPWRRQPKPLRDKVIRFFTDRCRYPAGRKEILIKMETLANEVNDNRLYVSRVLNQLQDEGLMELRRGRIIIPALEKIIM